MPIATVNPVSRGTKKKDALDRIMEGLAILKAGTGIYSDVQGIKKTGIESDILAQKKNNILDSEDIAKYKLSEAQQGEAGAFQARVKDNESGDIKTVWFKPREDLSQMADKIKILQGIQDLDPNSLKNIAARQGLVNARLAEQRTKQELETPSQGQSIAALYAKNLEQANNIFDELSEKGFQRQGFGTALQSYLPEALKPGDLKKQDQAEKNFLLALLRRQSGATIRKEEMEEGERQYFPRAGDTSEVLHEKRINRLTALAGLKAEAGDVALRKIEGPLSALVSSKTRMPQRNTKESGGDIGTAQAAEGSEDISIINNMPYRKVKGGWELITPKKK